MISRRRAKATRSATPSSMRSGSGSARIQPTARDLPFLLEDRLEVLPTLAVTLGSPGMWIRAEKFGVDFAKLVHYEQADRLSTRRSRRTQKLSRARASFPPATGGRAGARSSSSNEEFQTPRRARGYCTLRADPAAARRRRFRRRTAEATRPRSSRTARRTRLRFSGRSARGAHLPAVGRLNPLHADPEAAKRAGFDRPILHGLASYAIAGVAVARALGRPPAELIRPRLSFTGIVVPGDALISAFGGKRRRRRFRPSSATARRSIKVLHLLGGEA